MATGLRSGVESNLQRMRRSLQFPIAPGRKIAACVCLVAALLLWFPLWVAAWQSNQMNCCTGGMCPAHGHDSEQGHSPSGSQRAPMNCDHGAGGGLIECSMSCCRTEAHSFVTAIFFLLPPVIALSRIPGSASLPTFSSERAILPPVAPPDLPPRLSFC